MKNFLRLALCLLFSCMMTSLFAQAPVATGGCNSVSVDASGLPSFPNDLYFKDNLTGGTCIKTLGAPVSTMQRKFVLQVFNHATQSFNVQTTQTTSTFNNLAKGRYRVSVQVPFLITTTGCSPSNTINVVDNLGRRIGRAGDFSSFISNEVLVGNTGADDVSFILGEVGDIPSPDADFNEQLRMDATASKHHTHYKIQVRRDDNAWYEGPWEESSNIYTNLIDLTQAYGYVFWPNHDYFVTLVLKNDACYQTWRSKTQTFSICPSGTGCKENYEATHEEPISFFPNPANTGIELQNYEINSSSDQRIMITDMIGKTLMNNRLTTTRVNVSNLTSGLYVLNIIEDGKLVFTDKLVVN